MHLLIFRLTSLLLNCAENLRTLFPLTAFKNAPNPKFVQNLSQRLFLGVPVRGTEICKKFAPKNNRWGKFWTNLGFGAFLNAVRRKSACNRKLWRKRGKSTGEGAAMLILNQHAGQRLRRHVIGDDDVIQTKERAKTKSS